MDRTGDSSTIRGESSESNPSGVPTGWRYDSRPSRKMFVSSDSESSNEPADDDYALTKAELAECIRARQFKVRVLIYEVSGIVLRPPEDSLQDAYLDIFLLNLVKSCSWALERREDVQRDAKRVDLFEKMDTFSKSKGAGPLDSDINERLNERRKLLNRQLEHKRPAESTIPAAFTSAQELLKANLAAEKSHREAQSGLQSLKDTAERQALMGLTNSLNQDRTSSTFAVGGTLSVLADLDKGGVLGKNGMTDTSGSGVTSPIRIWWKTAEREGRLSFPLPEGESTPELSHFAEACQPATFGRGQDEVLDESYRKAGKLELADFLTDFCPYKEGIIEQITQMLCAYQRDGRIICKLYKLNVYSGPSGKFRSHVDTPQHKDHFGSLVVCLPTRFRGGDLEVRHEGRSEVFCWGDNQSNVQWAAFYNDCEHEVTQVREGHRITLTYNLFWEIRSPKDLSGVDPETLSVCRQLRALLKNPGFFRRGAVFGVPCSHYYAHNSDWETECLPSNLKGSDRALFLALEHLKIKHDLTVILANSSHQYGGISIEEFYETGGIEVSERPNARLTMFQHRGFREKTSRFHPQEKKIFSDLRLKYIGEDEERERYRYGRQNRYEVHRCAFEQYPFKSSTVEERVTELMGRRVKGVHPEYLKGTGVVLAHAQDGVQYFPETNEDESFDYVIDKNYPHSYLPQIVWLQEPKNNAEGVQINYLAHGNQPSLEWTYSRVALIFIIPPWRDRSDGTEFSESNSSTLINPVNRGANETILGKRAAVLEEGEERPSKTPLLDDANASKL